MIGTAVERQGIIRHGAKMISAVSEATVPKLSVIVRKAYGAGLYAMAGPAFEPDCCIALPSASIAVMGPQAAINAVFYNQIQAIEDEAEREALRRAQARGVRRRHRHPPPRLGAGRRRCGAARGPARRADPPLRAGGGQGALLRRAPQPDHARLGRSPRARRAPPYARVVDEPRRGDNGRGALRPARRQAGPARPLASRLPPVAVTGLLGPSGCGKTTLMRAIVGVQIVEAGPGRRCWGEPAGSRRLRSRVGYVTQAPSVYGDLSVRENLRFFARVLGVGRERIDEVIETVALGDEADRVVGSLSGGQQARVSLATALLGDPDVLVLDEPTVGLDPVLRRDLWATFAALAARRHDAARLQPRDGGGRALRRAAADARRRPARRRIARRRCAPAPVASSSTRPSWR